MSQKVYLNILKFGVYLSLLVVFFVFKNLLFPFITSKQIAFNILIEILLIIWFAFIVKYPDFRPKLNYVWFGLVAFFSAMVASSFTGIDFNLSFWGDVERMLGAFHILHFLGLYFIMVSVFREWKDWKILFILSTVLAVLVSYYGMTQVSYSTIGNTAYVSGYLIFNIFFSLILFFKEDNKMLRWLYFIPIVIQLMSFKIAGTSGAYVGMAASVVVMFFLYAVLSKNKVIKYGTLGVGIFLVAFISILMLNRTADWVKNSPYLYAAYEIDFQKNTFQTRLISWKAALKDFKAHPILGTGHGNYAATFDRYFDPTFYNHTRSETYFDRAHNNVIDIASTTGSVGLITYLAIFIAVAYYLIQGYRKKRIGVNDFVLISSLLIAYFVQNLAVFDSLVTYMGLMITLAYLYYLYNREDEDLSTELEAGVESETAPFDFGDYAMIGGLVFLGLIFGEADGVAYFAANNMRILWIFVLILVAYIIYAGIRYQKEADKREGDVPLVNKEIFALVGAALILITVLYQYNVKPLKMLIGTIDGQRANSTGNTAAVIDEYKKALGYNTILDRDSRTSLIRLVISNPNMLKQLGDDEAKVAIDWVIMQAEINVDYNEGDSLNQMILAQTLNVASTMYQGDSEKFGFYSGRSLAAIDKAIEASPGRIPIYFQKAQIYITRGEKDKALETIEYASGLNEDYYDSFCHLGRTYLFYSQEEKGYENIGKCIDKGGAGLLSPAGLIKSYINYYVEAGDMARVVKLYERLVQLEPKSTENLTRLAGIYSEMGDKEKARATAEKAIEIDPSIKKYAEEFINGL